MKAIYINDERTLNLLKGAVGQLGMQVIRQNLSGAEPTICDDAPITLLEVKALIATLESAEEVEDDGVDPDFLSDAERFVVASGIGALFKLGAGAPESVVLSITEKLGLVMTGEQKQHALRELAVKLVTERD